MEFGRLPSVEGIDFSMPEDPCWNGRLQSRLTEPPGALQLRMGMASWSDPGLVKRLGGTSESALSVHSMALPSNELNSTFYGYAEERFSRWRKRVPEGFRFCPKLPSPITHERVLESTDEEMARFVDATEALGPTRGLTWFALPPFVPSSHVTRLTQFLKRWSSRLPLAVEVRHESWFERRTLEDLVQRLVDTGTAFIITDTVGRRDALHMHLSSSSTMIRFVANALHPSDYERLDAWVNRLRFWSSQGLAEAYFFFHQKTEAETVDLAEHMEARLAASPSAGPHPDSGPAPVLGPWRAATGYRPPPQQLGLFGP